MIGFIWPGLTFYTIFAFCTIWALSDMCSVYQHLPFGLLFFCPHDETLERTQKYPIGCSFIMHITDQRSSKVKCVLLRTNCTQSGHRTRLSKPERNLLIWKMLHLYSFCTFSNQRWIHCCQPRQDFKIFNICQHFDISGQTDKAVLD